MQDERIQRAQIKRYVNKAYLAKLQHMNEERQRRKCDAKAKLAQTGHGPSSSAWLITNAEIEDQCIAEMTGHHTDLYITAYEKQSLKIDPEVLSDIADSHTTMVSTRKSTLIAEAQMTGIRTNTTVNTLAYANLGNKASIALKDAEAKIDLYNLTPKKADPVTITNNTYHLFGYGNRIVYGDDNSVNIINERELFENLTTAITAAVHDERERSEIIQRLDDLKNAKSTIDYLNLFTKFTAAALSISHVIAPYLPALIEKADGLR